MACGCQAGEVRHGRAGHESDAGRERQSKDVARPCERDIFEDRGDGRHHSKAGVLVPGGRQPVGGQRGGQRTTNDEAEIAAAGAGDGGGRPALIQQRDHGGRIARLFRQRPAEFAEPGGVFGKRRDATIGNGGEVTGSARGGIGK